MTKERSEVDIIRELRTRNAVIRKRADGIVLLHHPPEFFSSTFEDFLENYKALLSIQEGEISPLLMNVGNVRKVDSASKIFMNKTLPEIAHKMAMVPGSGSALTRLTVKTYFILHRPPISSKIFRNDAEAIDWLKEDLF
ncbi:MAG: hypothetical protein ACK40M_11740 [Flavobacteriales bacterium]